ncbi:MAG TPA: type I-E CRISPR-associated protein Cas5/CasD [Gammaproteobacteria bacterium]|nr:type I-E CRISPR-associated protein Cas5/CasD [Gammaproteobacteria bacterium]
MTDYLLFQLYGPMVSWGTQAVGQERPTEDHPGRSALLGLLAAALGIHREDDDQHQALSQACRFGIKLCAPGLAMRDFHTTQVPPSARNAAHRQTRRDELREAKLGTILSFRSYQQDALSVVAVSSLNDAYSLDQLKAALLTPHYHLYFGRKSCPPALPLNPEIASAESLKVALDTYCVDSIFDNVQKDKPRYYWEAGETPGMEESYRVPRYDQPLSRQRWQFTRRDEFAFLGDQYVPE